MVNPSRWSPLSLRTVLLGALVLSGGCHYVKRGDFDTEVARIRQDMANGDQRVAGQVSALDAKMDARMRTLEQGLRDFEDEFGARVDRIEGSLRVQAPIHFEFDDASIESDQLPVLERLASVLKEYYPDALVTVEGFTDPAGSRAYNLKLGQKRAEQVREWLVTAGGLSAAQVRAVSYGEESARVIVPGANGPGEVGRENRRAVIVIDHPDAGAARRAVTED
jgi:peptidoglycan-associated lipoprotein